MEGFALTQDKGKLSILFQDVLKKRKGEMMKRHKRARENQKRARRG